MRYALRTFGSSAPKRRHFDTIDELEHGGYGAKQGQTSGAGLYGGEARTHWVAEVQGGSGHTGHDTLTVMGRAKGAGDNDEEAIIQTRTASVTYDYSPPH